MTTGVAKTLFQRPVEAFHPTMSAEREKKSFTKTNYPIFLVWQQG
jgi:hypothetical protein